MSTPSIGIDNQNYDILMGGGAVKFTGTNILNDNKFLYFIPSGAIIMWYGSIATIPAGWVICNGTNGTPDLRNKFVIGAGSTYGVNSTGGSTNVTLTTSNLPAHNHTATSTFTGNTLPTHNHTVNDSGHSHEFYARGDDGTGSGAGYGVVGYNSNVGAGSGNMSSATTGISINAITAGTPTGTVSTTIGNTGSGTAVDILNPYYALCFIMKT